MTTRRLLLLVPLAVVLALGQSYFWVPDYEHQVSRAPSRALKLVEASIGDARILNPILNADASSSRVTGLVFDGLLDLDEDLRLRGRLAVDWRLSETAYLLVDRTAVLPDGSRASAERLAEHLRAALSASASDGRPEIRSVTAVGPRPMTLAEGDTRVDVEIPASVRLDVDRVDQDLMARLAPLLGASYGDGIERASWLAAPRPDEIDRDWLAERLPLLEHNPVVDFTLREDARFHDGHPFDAGDVLFTYEALMDPHNLSPRTSDFEPVKSIEIVGDHAVRIVYKRLFSPAVNAWTIGILPAHLLDAEAMREEMDQRGIEGEARERFGLRDSRFNRAPIGTGAFRFVEWRSDEVIHLARNEDYWDGPPLMASYHFRVLPDPLAQEIEFRTGAVDVFAPQPHQVDGYRRDRRYSTLSSLRLGYSYIAYNARLALFADPRTRRALSMALDVEKIIRHVVHGEGERITGPYAKETPWYDTAVPTVPYDPQGALALLRELGWERDEDGWLTRDGARFEFNLITNNGNLARKSIATIAQASWRRIGVKVNTQLFEWAVFLEDFINPGRFDAVILGWVLGTNPDLYQLWHSSQTGPHQLNFAGYESTQADALIERIRQEYALAEQRRLAHELHRVIARDQPYTFLYAPVVTRALDAKLAMAGEDGASVPIRAGKGANTFVHMNRWRKLEEALEP